MNMKILLYVSAKCRDYIKTIKRHITDKRTDIPFDRPAARRRRDKDFT